MKAWRKKLAIDINTFFFKQVLKFCFLDTFSITQWGLSSETHLLFNDQKVAALFAESLFYLRFQLQSNIFMSLGS